MRNLLPDRTGSLAALVLSLSAALAPASAAAADDGHGSPHGDQLARLEAMVERAEDLRDIKKLQKAYGYYLDKGMWTDLAEFFTEDAVAAYPAGTYVGKDSIRRHLYLNVGAVAMGEVGLGDNRLYNHMNIQPVVHLGADGTAHGRWRALAMFGRYGSGPGIWAEGVYNMRYAKEDGVWKISNLDYHAGFGAPYTEGWGANPDAGRGDRERDLPHPADQARERDCDGFPQACIIPFHYDNPGTSDDAHAWPEPENFEVAAPSTGQAAKRAGDLLQRARRLHDEQAVENLQRIYGYYLDRARWDQVADLFAADGTLEMAQQGVYEGPERIRRFLALQGEQGLTDGWLNDHVQLQTIVNVSADGTRAWARSRQWSMTGRYQGEAHWAEGIYENTFVKENGVWKFQSVRYYPTFITDYDKGWTVDAQPAPGIDPALPPDRGPTWEYEIFPKAHVPPFHYDNPVTGEAPVYPERGGPPAEIIEATRMRPGRHQPDPVNDVAHALDQAEALLGRVKDYHELENLENAYGYYLDKNLWNDLADLFAEDGSMELAQRGVYRGRERVRAFLFNVFGDEGPVEGRLGNHIHMQPVIHVDEGGRSARIRSRMMQQMNFGGRPSLGAAVYENVAVKEDGRWKFRSTHAFNTFTASYHGGWSESPGGRVPGPSEAFPPDAPPSMEFAMFPSVYEIPFHYANPVSGRR